MNFYDFSGIEKCEQTIQTTWDQFREALEKRIFLYSEINIAKAENTFMRVFDEIFSNCKQMFDVSIGSNSFKSFTFLRAGKLNHGDPEPTYSRFVPDKKFIKNHNRFSPPEVEWLYLAMGDWDKAENCALKECRAEKGDKFGICQFEINKKYYNKKIVDLTIANNMAYEDINNQLENISAEMRKQEVDRLLKNIKHGRDVSPPDVSDFKELFIRWVACTYAKLLSRQIFIPLEANKELVYAPFQCMAQYFLSFEYEGIIYESTVCPDGKNIVLFDKYAAEPIGKIKTVFIS